MGHDLLDRPLQHFLVALAVLVLGSHRVRQIHHRAPTLQVVCPNPVKDVDNFRPIGNSERRSDQGRAGLVFGAGSGVGGVLVESSRTDADL